MDIQSIAQGVFMQTFKPLVPYTPQGQWIQRPDGSRHYRRESTGNLRHNATKFEVRSATEFELFIDEDLTTDENGVSYMPFTNEPWTSPKWRGAKNPNEGWFPRAVLAYANALAAALGGTVEITEV